MNEYYTPPADIAALTRARSATINELNDAVDDGFDNLPADLQGTQDEVVEARSTYPSLDDRLDYLSDTVSAGLPSLTGNANKALTVKANELDTEWSAINPRKGAISTSSATDITLTSTAPKIQILDFTADEKFIILPDATGLEEEDFAFIFKNDGAYRYGIKNSSGALVASVNPGCIAILHLTDNTSAAGTWMQDGDFSLTMSRLKTVCNAVATIHITACQLSATEALICYVSASQLYALVLTWVPGTPEITVSNILNVGAGTAATSCCKITSTTAFIAYQGTNSDGFCSVISYDGVDTLTTLDTYEFADAETVDNTNCVALHATKILVLYENVDNDLYGQVLDWDDGTDTISSDTAATNLYTGSITTIPLALLSGAVDSGTVIAMRASSMMDVIWNGVTLTTTGNAAFVPAPAAQPTIAPVDSSHIVAVYRDVQIGSDGVILVASLVHYAAGVFTILDYLVLDVANTASFTTTKEHLKEIDTNRFIFTAVGLEVNRAITYTFEVFPDAGQGKNKLKLESKSVDLSYEADYHSVVVLDANNAIRVYEDDLNSAYLSAEKLEVA